MRRVEIETPHGFYEVWGAYLWPLRLSRWAGKRRREVTCRLIGHRWTDWRPSTTMFVPPETRFCRRCHRYDYRGETPTYEIVFEWGTVER